MSEDLLKAKSSAEEQLEDIDKMNVCEMALRYIDYNNNDPTYEIRSRFVRIYLRLFYWIGIAVENENMKKYMRDDLNRMLATFNNHI